MSENPEKTTVEDEITIILKVVMIGDSGVGKSNLLSRFCEGRFSELSTPTIGVEFIPHDTQVNNQKVSIHFWDTAGQEKYRGITSSYYKDAHGVCLVYDVTNKNSFLNLEIWLDEIRNFCSKEITVTLVGNKIDCEDKRRVSTKEGEVFAVANSLFYYETSAKLEEGGGVDVAFRKVIEEVLKKTNSEGMKKDMERHVKIRQTAENTLVGGKEEIKKFCC